MAGLPVAGIGTMFYLVLGLGIGATKLFRWGQRRVGILLAHYRERHETGLTPCPQELRKVSTLHNAAWGTPILSGPLRIEPSPYDLAKGDLPSVV